MTTPNENDALDEYQENTPKDTNNLGGSTDDAKSRLTENLSMDVNQFAADTIATLREQIGMECDITREKKVHIYHVNAKGVPLQSGPLGIEGQIAITITTDCKINVRFNVYGANADYVFYNAKHLSAQELVKEMATMKAFLTDGTAPAETSKIKKDSQGGGRTPSEMDKYLEEMGYA